MFRNVMGKARGVAVKAGAVVGGSMLSMGAAFAQETPADLQTQAMALIDTNKATALAIAGGITLAILALKFVKLPRRG